MQFLKKLQPYFSFTPGERRGVFVLLCIMGLSIFVRILMPFFHSEKQAIFTVEALNISLDSAHQNNLRSQPDNDFDIFSQANQSNRNIDPNTASKEELISVGFSEFAAQNISKYRKKGGVFYSISDLYKIYGVDSTKVDKISKSIYIKKFPAETAKKDKSVCATNSLIDLNSADSIVLLKISGVGAVLSGRIIKYRSLLGGFVRKEQLKEIYGIDENTFNNIVSNCAIDTMQVIKLKLNSANESTFERHPYISNYQAKAIIKYRKLVGNFNSFADLKQSNIFSDQELNRIILYFSLN
jgi:competence protein ComEA